MFLTVKQACTLNEGAHNIRIIEGIWIDGFAFLVGISRRT